MKFRFQTLDLAYLKRWLLFSIAAGFALPLFFYPQGYISVEGWKKIWDDIVYSFLISMSVSSSVGLVEANLNQIVNWIEAPVKRFFLEVIAVSIFAFSGIFIVSFLFFWARGMFTLDNIPWQRILETTKLPMYIAYGITAFFVSRAFLREWRNAAVNVEKLRTEKYRGQVRLLRDQLNPHFLFNSFNVLIDVIYQDQDEAADYVRELSKFYRHILEVQSEDLVPLEQELAFTRRYVALQQRRFGDALKVSENITPNIKEEIPPLVLQLLVENAIKHNTASENQPLEIAIYHKEGFLVVENTLQRKQMVESGTGIGLENISKRYELLTNQKVIVSEQDHLFKVKLPVIIPEQI